MSKTVVACGALALHIQRIATRRGWDLDVRPLPPELHNRPERIRAAIDAARDADVVAERVTDPLRPVVQLGRQRPHLELPAAPLRDLVDVERERAAGDDRPHPGNCSWSMKRSLKSARPDSST